MSETSKSDHPRGEHRPLPARRRGATYEARIAGIKVYVTTGDYDDGTLGEIFIDVAKEGSATRGFCHCFAIAFSKALQHGTPLEELVGTFRHTCFEPSGAVTGQDGIARATSIPDYVSQLLAREYLRS